MRWAAKSQFLNGEEASWAFGGALFFNLGFCGFSIVLYVEQDLIYICEQINIKCFYYLIYH